jgi:hypothetical protein
METAHDERVSAGLVAIVEAAFDDFGSDFF